MRKQPNLPAELVGRYVLGEITSAEVARLAGTSTFKVLHELRRLGIDTSLSSRKLLQALRRAPVMPRLEPGQVPARVVELYQRGLSLRQVSTRFGLSHECVRQMLLRQGVVLRSGVLALATRGA
jgi:hypothetical protein